MDDDEYGEEVEVGPAVRMTWADVAYSALWPLRGAAEGVANFCRVLQSALDMHSRSINEKQAFARDAGLDIEALTRGTDG